jgi:hypothetical protein
MNNEESSDLTLYREHEVRGTLHGKVETYTYVLLCVLHHLALPI